MSDDVTRLAKVLAEHADCALNDATDLGAAATGRDVWSCGITVPFGDDLEEAERAHLAHVIAPLIAEARLLGATQAQSDAIDAHAELVARMEALCGPCENYATPGQDCITAGPEVFSAEACTSCVIRAALNDPTEETTP